MNRFLRLIMFVCFVSVVLLADAKAMDIQEVNSPSGIKAWLVEDHKLPILAIHFAFRGGVEQDPLEKQGLTDLTIGLLTQGAGSLDAAAFQQKLADHAVMLNFSSGRDALQGSLKCLTEEKSTAYELAALALTKPSFDTKEIEQLRARQLAGLRFQLGNPEWQARYALFQKIFGSHPYGLRHLGTLHTLATIKRSDIEAFSRNHFAKDNLVVAVAGDITPDELSKALDVIFGGLPTHAKETPVVDVVWPQDTATILTQREGTQTELFFAMPGPKRDDPDWYATEIANYILGGGGFSSRLMHEVRDKKGLTYGVNTSVSAMEHASLIVGEAATDNPKSGKAWDLILETMRKLYDEGITNEELNAAKDYLVGSLPLALTSTDKIAGNLVELQLDHRPIDYFDQRNAALKNVTEDDVNRALHQWFNPERMTLSMVGKPEGIVPTLTRERVRE